MHISSQVYSKNDFFFNAVHKFQLLCTISQCFYNFFRKKMRNDQAKYKIDRKRLKNFDLPAKLKNYERI